MKRGIRKRGRIGKKREERGKIKDTPAGDFLHSFFSHKSKLLGPLSGP
jgi:hypothetical protein